jgi:hypothetical protein
MRGASMYTVPSASPPGGEERLVSCSPSSVFVTIVDDGDVVDDDDVGLSRMGSEGSALSEYRQRRALVGCGKR